MVMLKFNSLLYKNCQLLIPPNGSGLKKKKKCSCITFRQACLLLAILFLICHVVAAIIIGLATVHEHEILTQLQYDIEAEEPIYRNSDFTDNAKKLFQSQSILIWALTYIQIFFALVCFNVLFGIILLIGLNKRNKLMILIWHVGTLLTATTSFIVYRLMRANYLAGTDYIAAVEILVALSSPTPFTMIVIFFYFLQIGLNGPEQRNDVEKEITTKSIGQIKHTVKSYPEKSSKC